MKFDKDMQMFIEDVSKSVCCSGDGVWTEDGQGGTAQEEIRVK